MKKYLQAQREKEDHLPPHDPVRFDVISAILHDLLLTQYRIGLTQIYYFNLNQKKSPTQTSRGFKY